MIAGLSASWRWTLPAALVVAGWVATDPLFAGTPTSASAFKIYVDRTAVYRVGFDDLAAVAPGLESLPSKSLVLTHLGTPVPLWLEDGGDSRFGAADHLEFLGEHLAGEKSYFHEEIRYNVYRLALADGMSPADPEPRTGVRMVPGPPLSTASAAEATGARRLLGSQHLEENALRIRVPPAEGGVDELWYWSKIIGGYPAFSQVIDLPHLDRRPHGRGVDLRMRFRGWSRPRFKGDPSIPDHHVEVAVNSTVVAQDSWNGRESYLVEMSDLPVELFTDGENTVEISSPKRLQADGEQLIDVVLLDWIEVHAPSSVRIGDAQERWTLDETQDDKQVDRRLSLHFETDSDRDSALYSTPRADLLVYGASGWRTSASLPSPAGDLEIVPPPEERVLIATRASALMAPVAIDVDWPSGLRAAGRGADYVMIAHSSLLDAIEPLAAMHRRRGLAVTVVDVEDVYDEFSHGVRDPRAIQRFLSHAQDHWSPPAPRFALLVGDASWDVSNEIAVDANYADWSARPREVARFVKNRSTPYETDAPPAYQRNLIPTLTYLTHQGPAASDNAFVIEDEDDAPYMAIGRLPVTQPREVAAIVRKTIRYVEQIQPGPWRQRMVFITSETPAFQRSSARVAASSAAEGYHPVEVYPASAEASNEHHTAKLLQALDHGALAVHFYGHGGRYIWRTGPPDLEKNHDLLTLEDLDRLAPSLRLPVILSMTCYSAPFDHPIADSIGEKFLRLADRGAVAVIAASWRNGPRPAWGETILRHLITPGATVGEALQRAKHDVRHRLFVHTYNLLGDPAVPMALPEFLAGTPDPPG